jgi:hypothetical protein
MRVAGSASDPRGMARTSITVDLDFDETIDSPSGTARLADGTSRTFHGWLALAEAIGAFATRPAPDDTTPTGTAHRRALDHQQDTQP